MSRRTWVIELVTQIVGDKPTAEMVVDRLMEEGLLVLGYGDTDVEMIVTTFSDTFGVTRTSRQDRFAAHRLAEKYTGQAIAGIVRLLGERSGEKYAPVVNNVAQLEEKMPSVLNFLRAKGDEFVE
jgi:hypothetical protein